MATATTGRLRRTFGEQLADSLRKPLPHLTPRRVFGKVRFPGKVTVILGMRRAGKTTYLHQLRRQRIEQGAARESLPYISFEDERLTDLDAAGLDLLLSEHARQLSDAAAANVIWHFDEIQVVTGWERFVRRLLDTERAEVLITGSSSALLSREIATALRGRAWQVLIHPFSFEEALRHAGQSRPDDLARLSGRDRARLEQRFLEWLTTGGFPEAQGLDPSSRHQLLRDYVDVALLRDVVERHGVRNVAGLRWLVRHLLGNAAGLFSIEKFRAALKSQGIPIAKDTLHQLLGYLEDCFLVRTVWMESASERQRMVNPRKAYPVDPGLIPVFDRTGRANVGHALETAVLVELERRRYEVTYVRTPEGYEVDFLARAATGEMDLIQVCADLSDPGTAARECRALDAAGKQFPGARKRLLVLMHDGLSAEPPAGTQVQTAWEWLLGSDE